MELGEVSETANLLHNEQPEPVRLSRSLIHQAISTELELVKTRLDNTFQKCVNFLSVNVSNNISVNFSSNIRSKFQKHGPTIVILLLVFLGTAMYKIKQKQIL